MYIYNVTINIEERVHDAWFSWLKNIHIPEMLALGKFSNARICKVLVDEEMGGITYSIQYTVKDKATLERYYKEDAEKMRQEGQRRFPNQFVAFRTELEVLDELHCDTSVATEYLFAYGTLLKETLQESLYSRVLQAADDKLSGYQKSAIKVAGRYPSLMYTAEDAHFVSGKVMTLTGAELLKTDTYEGAAYFRKKVVLESGKNAWVYLGKDINPG